MSFACYVDEKRVEFPSSTVDGADLLAAAGADARYHVFKDTGERERHPEIGVFERVCLGQTPEPRFYVIPDGNPKP